MVAALAGCLRVLIPLNYQFLGALLFSYNRIRSSIFSMYEPGSVPSECWSLTASTSISLMQGLMPLPYYDPGNINLWFAVNRPGMPSGLSTTYHVLPANP
jgi:hypothetical protein